MEFDFKVTAWERVTVPKEFEVKVLEGIKDGSIRTANDIFSFVDHEGDGASCDLLHETLESMSKEENDNQSVIEVLEGSETIYTN